MMETIRVGDVSLAVTHKDIKHVHLSVHPPSGRVTLVAPIGTRPEVARAFAVSKLDWIRAHQTGMLSQARETPRQFVTRETHYLWGRRYLLTVREEDAKPAVRLNHRRIVLTVRPRSSRLKREAVIHGWHKSLLHGVIPPLIHNWELKLGVKVAAYYIQRMKTKWGGCNHRTATIRLNTELVKKPRDLLEYVVVHEMIHLIAPTHGDQFTTLMTEHFPSWREARVELNELPLAAAVWKE